MKVLFVNPYIYDFTAFDLWLRPLGNLYLASVVEKYSDAEVFWIDALDRFQDAKAVKSTPYGTGKYHRVIVEKPAVYKDIPRNYSRYGIPIDSFRVKLNSLEGIDIVFVTTLMTYWIDGVNFTIREVRKRFPDAAVVVGGILPTVTGDTVKTHVDGDIFISGYGEERILKLLETYGAVVNEHPDFSNPDNIPFPLNRFLASKKTLPLLTSRGCPYRCTYCASHILNPKFTQRSPESIVSEIRQMNRNYGTRDFIIFDDAFLINKAHRFFPVFNNFKNDDGIRFHTPNGIHAGEIDRDTAQLFFDAGFRTIRLSFESTGKRILKKSADKINVSQMEDAVENLLAAGYRRSDIECYILFGLPAQSKAELTDSLNFVRKLGILPRLSYFSPVPGTPEFNNLRSKGLLLENDYLYRTNKLYFIHTYSGLSGPDIDHFRMLTREICRSARGCEN